MKVKAYKSFRKYYQKLSKQIQRKVDKQIRLLAKDFHHPSLHVKKIKGTENIWEARIDAHHRMSFEIETDTIFLRVVGKHEILRSP